MNNNFNQNPAFRNNPNLRPLGQNLSLTEFQVKEIIKCAQYPIYFMEEYCHINDLDLGIVKINLRDYQRYKMLPALMDFRFNLFLQCRQSGKSVIVGLFLLHHANFNSNQTIVYLGNKAKIASEQLLRIKIAYERLPQWLKMGIKNWAVTSIELENGSRIFVETTSETSSRGFSINFLVLDEFAFVRPNIQRGFMASVYPTIIASKVSKMAILSTLPLVKNKTELEQNLFWQLRKAAIKGTSDFHYTQIDSYEVPGRDEKFKAKTIENLGGDSLARLTYSVEFENKVIFSSAKKLINPDTIKEHQNNLMTPIELKPLTDFEGFVEIYEDYRPDSFYVMGIDTGKGIESDYSVINMFRYNLLENKFFQVAHFSSNKIHASKIFPKVAIEMCGWYNHDVMLGCENNDIGYATVNKIDEILQENNIELIFVNLSNSNPAEIGIRMTKPVRTYIMLDLKSRMEIDQSVIFRCKQTLDEIDTIFENNRGKFEGLEHDDELFSSCMGLLGYHQSYREVLRDFALDKSTNPVRIGEQAESVFDAKELAYLMHS